MTDSVGDIGRLAPRTTDLFTPCHRGGSGPPLLLLHGFMDSWRSWEIVLPALERRYETVAPTFPGHAGGPPLPADVTDRTHADFAEQTLDELGWDRARIAGNSLGGFIALELAARGRAEAVIALAPAGGWASTDEAQKVFRWQRALQRQVRVNAAHADSIAAAQTRLPAESLVHQMLAVARCEDAGRMIDAAGPESWSLEVERIDCPVRIVWGTADEILPWPSAAARWRRELPHADWIELDGVGHYPQLEAATETAELIASF